MSEALHLKAEIDALCKAAGLEPDDVTYISLDADTRSVRFTVYPRPLRYNAKIGGPESVVITFPFEYKT